MAQRNAPLNIARRVTTPVANSNCRWTLVLKPAMDIRRTKGRNMIGEIIVVGDLKLREHAPLDEYNRLGERMYEIVSRLPGFLSVKSFKAEDGEELTLFRFASEEALEAWRTHPEHVETMKRGHAEFYASGFLQICKVIREVGPFEHS
ncbi:antibiotic biosynthesis monooxygenase [Bradyrhizobium sp. CER78]|uniref:antibiotic biosynthesis monooxygenase family protein n=1 Tax=Bradyrhizobium sp. CER78 TaxID=3039162 RepID=UPI002448EA59|nr:antibiotic biosynthesis monooxygenase [Bradyrhizobium sp. CER78]MDH2385069.1 antibiotic biosynthesis monooxygenase [Bradyrhizobium sp. CER78]